MTATRTPRPAVAPTAGPRHSLFEDLFGLLVGTVLASFGLFLLHSSTTVTGGTAGLSLLLSYAFGVPFSGCSCWSTCRSWCWRCLARASRSPCAPWWRSGR